MSINATSPKSKLSKRRQYIGNIYVRPRQCFVLDNSYDSFSSCSASQPEGVHLRMSSDSFDAQPSTDASSVGLLVNADNVFSREKVNFDFDYARNESTVTSKKLLSRELGFKRHERQPVSANKVNFASAHRSKVLRKKISVESRRPKGNSRRTSFDDLSELTSSSSMEEQVEFNIEDDTSTF